VNEFDDASLEKVVRRAKSSRSSRPRTPNTSSSSGAGIPESDGVSSTARRTSIRRSARQSGTSIKLCKEKKLEAAVSFSMTPGLLRSRIRAG
jgi:hypothetical protein